MISSIFVVDSLMSGGVEYQLLELTRNMDTSQFKVTVICLYGDRAGRSLHFLPMFEEANIPTILLDLDWSAQSKIKAIQLLASHIRRIKPDIVHAFNYHSNLLTRLSRPLWFTGAKLIGSVLNAQTNKQLLYDSLSQPLYHAIVCNGKQLCDDLIEKARVRPNKVHHIPNGIDLARFQQPSQHNPFDSLGYSPRRAILMVGRITQQKSPHILAQAVGLLVKQDKWNPQDRVFIIGEMQASDTQWQDKLNDAIKTYQLDEIVVQLPTTHQIEAFYQSTHITVMASLWEGLPNVVLESLASGTPVIVSEAANSAGVIEHNLDGWIVPTSDVEQLSDQLYDVLCLSDVQLDNMTQACMDKASQYTIPIMVQAHQDLYQQLLQ